MRGESTTLSTALPKSYRAGAIWKLDRRCKAVKGVGRSLVVLWQDLGGYEALSAQQRILCERVAFIHHQVVVFESAVLSGREPPFDHGTYSNLANVLAGYLKRLGLERKARRAGGLQDYLERAGAVA